MANYVLSTAFSDQVVLTYARAAVSRLREVAGEIAKRIAARNTEERRRLAISRDLRSLDRHCLQDIGLA